MGEQTTTASLRELAIAEADRADRERADREAAEHASLMEAVVRDAARHAAQILGELAEGAQWTALDERTAIAWIGGEPFRFRRSDGHWLYHVTTCPTCGHGRTAGVFSLEGLGNLLRTADPAAYDCETCEAAAAAIAQSASALARAIQQDVQTWGESS